MQVLQLQDKTIVLCIIIIAITILESIALIQGVNGILLATVMAVLVQLANLAYGKAKPGEVNTVEQSKVE